MEETKALCQQDGWSSFEDAGIVPYCIWKNVPDISEHLYYSDVDIPFSAGLIDGVYQEAEGLVLLPKMLAEIGNGIHDFTFAYTSAYLACHPNIKGFNELRLGELLAKLEESKNETGIWSWVKDQWYAVQSSQANHQKKICIDAENLRREVNELFLYLSERKNIKKLIEDVEQKLAAYFKLLEGKDNRSRYEHGKITVVVATFFIPAAGQLAKIPKVKKILEGLKNLTKSQLDELFERVRRANTRAGGFSAWKVAEAGGKLDNLITKLDNLELPNLRSKLDELDAGAKSRLADDLDGLSDDAIKQLEDNFGLLDEWRQIDELAISAQASQKPTWLQKILDGNEFNNIRSASYPNNEVYLINPNNPSKYVRLDSYKPDLEIVSRKYTQFSDIP